MSRRLALIVYGTLILLLLAAAHLGYGLGETIVCYLSRMEAPVEMTIASAIARKYRRMEFELKELMNYVEDTFDDSFSLTFKRAKQALEYDPLRPTEES